MRVNAVRQVVAALAAVALALAACTPAATTGPTAGGAATSGGGATAGAASGGGGAGSVEVTLREFEVLAQPASATAGEVTFEVTNDGPEDEHELVVIKTDLDPGDLPTDTNGAVDEEGDGIEVIDEVEEIPVGESESLTVDLEAGSYVLICNIFEDSENESHYQMGMRTAFDVQ